MSEIKTNKISPRKGTTQTIGDSGDTVSIPCGVTVTNAGTISTAGITGGTIDNQGTITGLVGVIEWDTTAKTTNFNASSQTGYFVDTTSGAITVTFPASPTAGDVIALKDYANTFDTNNLTLNANGNKIQGSTTNFTISVEGASSQFIYVDATRGWVLTDASKASDIAEAATFITATGGCISTCGDFKIHTFTGPGTFCVSSTANPAGGPNNVDYLVVAGGGGGGGDYGGGGAGGGYRESSGVASGCYTTSPLGSCVAALPVSVTAYPITVGGGGSGGAGSPGAQGGDGNNSIFSTITSTGGGGAGGLRDNGRSGGSGGGAGGVCGPNLGGSGNTPSVSPPQGNDGGDTAPGVGGTAGGGGALAAGSNGIIPTSGPGGAGATSSINGTPTTRAGGGGGGGYTSAGRTPGSGGPGGGGAGGADVGESGVAGTTNTGGGGGGHAGGNAAAGCGGAGGSGIVIIRYKYQ